MCEFNVSELFELYKNVFEGARDGGCDYDRAKEKAWQEIVEVCPDIVGSGNYQAGDKRTTLGSMVGGYLYSVKIKEGLVDRSPKQPAPKYQLDQGEIDYLEMNWKERWLALAKSGFIPFGCYFEPIIGVHKASQVSAYVSIMKTDYGMEYYKNDYGYVVTMPPYEPQPEPEPEPELLTDDNESDFALFAEFMKWRKSQQ